MKTWDAPEFTCCHLGDSRAWAGEQCSVMSQAGEKASDTDRLESGTRNRHLTSLSN